MDKKEDNTIINDSDNGKETDKPGSADAFSDKQNEYAELKEKMLRIAAEFDNYKKRTQNEVSRARIQGKVDLLRQIIPILDEFELAIISIQGSKEAKDGTGLFRGMEMVYANFKESLNKSGLSEISTDGAFNPMLHEVIMTKEDQSENGTIIEVIKRGYMFEGVLVRPASVIISSGAKE